MERTKKNCPPPRRSQGTRQTEPEMASMFPVTNCVLITSKARASSAETERKSERAKERQGEKRERDTLSVAQEIERERKRDII